LGGYHEVVEDEGNASPRYARAYVAAGITWLFETLLARRGNCVDDRGHSQYCGRGAVFSNPQRIYGGAVIGKAGENDNARAIRNRMPDVLAFGSQLEVSGGVTGATKSGAAPSAAADFADFLSVHSAWSADRIEIERRYARLDRAQKVLRAAREGLASEPSAAVALDAPFDSTSHELACLAFGYVSALESAVEAKRIGTRMFIKDTEEQRLLTFIERSERASFRHEEQSAVVSAASRT
jgi:hypothetical protein